MWSSRRRLLALGLLLVLGGCGFAPVYGPGGGGASLQGRVGLEAVQTREDEQLRQRLEARLGRAVRPDYALRIRTDRQRQGLGTTADERATLYQQIGVTEYALIDLGSGVVLTEGTVRAFASASATGSTVATLAAERDAARRLSVMLADAVVDRLVLFAAGGGLR